MVTKSPWSNYTDHFGRTVNSASLNEEIAVPMLSGARRVIGDAVASGLSPERLAEILRQSAYGYSRAYLTLAEEMEERYLHYASQLQTRRLAIEGIPVTIETPKSVPAKIREAVEGLVERTDFAEMIGSKTDGIGKGYSVSEIMWDYHDRLLKPVKYIWRDPRFFVFDELTQAELRLAVDGKRDGVPLDAAKFIVHSPRSKMGIPVRRGMARPAAWAFLIQSFGLRDWASFAEIYGVPLRIGKYNSAASDADKRTLLHAVRAIANDAAAIIPQGMEIEFAKIEGQHGTAVFGGLIDYVDKQVSKLVVGQTMTSDNGSSQAQAEVHDRVRLDIVTADCNQIAQTINRDLIIPFVVMNFGEQDEYPAVAMHVPKPEDIVALTSAVKDLVPLGLRVSARELRERIGLGEPTEGEELLGSAKPDPAPPAKPTQTEQTELSAVAGHVRGCRCSTCLTPLSAQPPEDGAAEVEQLGADIEWEDISDPIMTPIRRIMTEAKSFDEMLSMLDSEGPDVSRLIQALAERSAIARGIGDARD